MAHLKCSEHKRRVMSIPSGNVNSPRPNVVVHRSDGSHCDTKTMAIGKALIRLGLWEAKYLGI